MRAIVRRLAYDAISQRPITDRSTHLSLGERILLARRAYAAEAQKK